jgi:hypothetical protein
MAKSKKQQRPGRPARVSYSTRRHVPVHDALAELEPDDSFALAELVDYMTSEHAFTDYLTWEAVLCEEQGLPLTRAQKRALSELLDFSDDESDEILYINGMPRPSQPWYELVRFIAPRLLVEPFHTDGFYSETELEGCSALMEWLQEHGSELSLPEGIESPMDIVPAELRHKLRLQACFEILYGLGQEEEITLADPDQQDRVDGLIECLEEHCDSVGFFGLSLEKLLTMVRMPPKEEQLFLDAFVRKLRLPSARAPLAELLGKKPR